MVFSAAGSWAGDGAPDITAPNVTRSDFAAPGDVNSLGDLAARFARTIGMSALIGPIVHYAPKKFLFLSMYGAHFWGTESSA